MATITFDTLKFVETLIAGGIEESQAKAFAQAVRDAQGEADLATKADLRELEHRLKAWAAGMLLLQAGLIAALVKLL